MSNPVRSDAPVPRQRGRRAAVAAGLATLLALGAALVAARGLIREQVLLRRLESGEASEATIRTLTEMGSVRAIPILLEIAATGDSWSDDPVEPGEESRRSRWGGHSIPARGALEELAPKMAERARPALLAGLDSPRSEVRSLAAGLLGTPELRSPEVADRLVAALGDRAAQEEAERSLPRLGADALRPLIVALRGPFGPQADAAQRVVRELGHDARAAVPALIARLEDGPASERGDAVAAIADTCGASPAAARLLVAQLAAEVDGDWPGPATYALGCGCGGERATTLLRQRLSDHDPARRRQAAMILGNLWPGPRAAALDLIERLRDPDPGVRAAAALALGHLEGEGDRAVAALAEALDDPEPDVRENALAAFWNLSGSAVIPVALVEQRLQDTSRSVRWMAATVIFRIRGPEPSLLPACLDELRISRIPDDAVSLLVQLGPAAREAVPLLVKLVRNKDVGCKATRILGAIGPPAAPAVPALLEALDALESWDSTSFGHLSTALAGIASDDPRVVNALIEALRGQGEEHRLHAAAALWRLGLAREEALEALIASSDRIMDRLDLRGGKALGPEAVPRLLAALADPAVERRRTAARLLPHTGAARSDVLEALAARMSDEDRQVGRAAFQAIVELGGDPGSVLVQAFASPETRLPSWALWEIGTRKLSCDALLPALEAALSEPRTVDRFHAALVLLWIVPDHHEAGRTLAESAVRDEEDLNWLASHHDLHRMLSAAASRSPLAVEAILDYARTDPESLRRNAWSLEPAADGSAPFVAPLAAALGSNDETRRHIAAHLLRHSGSAGLPAVPALVACLDDPSPRVRARAALTLGAIGPAAAPLGTAALVRALARRDDPLLRSNAACALGDLGAAAREALPALVAIVLDERDDEMLRCLALEAATAIGGARLSGEQLDTLAGERRALRRYFELLRPDLEEASQGSLTRP